MDTKLLLLAVAEGRLPHGPDAKALRGRLLEALPDSGSVRIQFDGAEFPITVLGTVTGGFIAAMLDLTASSLAPAKRMAKRSSGRPWN